VLLLVYFLCTWGHLTFFMIFQLLNKQKNNTGIAPPFLLVSPSHCAGVVEPLDLVVATTNQSSLPAIARPNPPSITARPCQLLTASRPSPLLTIVQPGLLSTTIFGGLPLSSATFCPIPPSATTRPKPLLGRSDLGLVVAGDNRVLPRMTTDSGWRRRRTPEYSCRR
jgi:hypothetical protein